MTGYPTIEPALLSFGTHLVMHRVTSFPKSVTDNHHSNDLYKRRNKKIDNEVKEK
jgi:hypothetical protein